MSPERRALCNTENLSAIHEMGKKNQKYMKYKPSEAPFWKRSMCKYTEEFHPMPLGDSEINKQLAATFRPMAKPGVSSNSLSAKTAYRDDFPGYKGEKMNSAKLKDFKPEQQRHTKDQSLMVTDSHTHSAFAFHQGKHAPDSFAPKNQTHSNNPRLFTDYRSRYSETFNQDYSSGGPPGKLAQSSEDNSFRINGSSIPNKVRDYYNMRRACSAGNVRQSRAFDQPITDILRMSADEIRMRAEAGASDTASVSSKRR